MAQARGRDQGGTGPGARDVGAVGKGHRLVLLVVNDQERRRHPADVEPALPGGDIEQGEFVPGEPYLFARDLDGYMVEIWYELPTKVDPPS